MSSARLQTLRTLIHNERGQGLVEYTLIIMLTVAMLVAALSSLDEDLGDLIASVIDRFP